MSANHSKTRRLALLAAAVMAVTCLLAASAAAADHETLYSSVYCFSADDFRADGGAALTGVFVTDVPEAAVGSVRCGSRAIRAGDALSADRLASLTFQPACAGDSDAVIGYLPVTAGGVGAAQTMSIHISSGKNEAPTANDAALQTYKNVANSGALSAADPEGEAIRFDLTAAPKRGTVEIAEDGTFTYTPAKNKVGRDCFKFTATDAAGNVSNEATVTIEILKPTDKQTYADMRGDPDQFAALWMKNTGLLTGERVGGAACFCPDRAVTRGEFLVMLSKLTGMKPDDAEMTSGFADEGETPEWMRPYIVAALRAGVVSGTASDSGVVFRPDADVTAAEAAVMLRNALGLPDAQKASAFPADSAVPAWAESAVAALSEAGIPLDAPNAAQSVTRRGAAKLLYAASRLTAAKKS